jgi:hypothetical protein
MAKNKYGFKTGYGQHAIMLSDITVARAAADNTGYTNVGIDIGQVMTLSGTTLTEKHTGIAIGDYIIAQSDETVGYGHVPVENRDYKYVGTVMPGAGKNVVVYQVKDLADMVKLA